jgi:DNA primase catalytic subunit
MKDRKALDELNDGGRSPQRSALMDVVTEKRSTAEAEAKLAAKEAIKRINDEYRLSADYERWLREQNANYLADRWRNRNKLSTWLTTFDGKSDHFHHLQKVDGFEARELGGVRLWARRGERVAFVEHKGRIEVAMRKDDQAIIAAFTIAASKFGRVTVNGTHEFKNYAVAAIASAGYADAVANPELQGMLANLRSPAQVDPEVTKHPKAEPNTSSQLEPRQADVTQDAAVQKKLQDRGNGR